MGERTWCPKHLVLVAEGGVGMPEGVVVGVVVVAGLKVVCPLSSLLNMYAGLTLSADTMMGLLHTRSFSLQQVFFID
jgi:hypothetical protein